MKYCGNCGKPVKDDARFCPACGRVLRCPLEAAAADRTVRMKRTAALAVLAVFLIVLAVGCYVSAQPENALIGTWYQEDCPLNIVRFYKDGTCDLSGGYDAYRWSIPESASLRISGSFSGTEIFKIVYLAGDKLILSQGSVTATFYKI
ncbi:MAG: zinc-ribbon domain-containing protein [Faecousia sp.]